MLVQCQGCEAEISDTAARCPRCHAEPDAYLGPTASCVECGAVYRAAYRNCRECGAPGTMALGVQATVKPPLASETQPVAAEALWSDTSTPASAWEQGQQGNAEASPKKGFSTRIVTAVAALGAGALAVAIFVVPKLVGFTAGYVAVRSVSASTSNPQLSTEASVQKAWASLEADPSMGPYYREFRTGFPDDYAAFVEAWVNRARASTDKEGDWRFGFEYMQSFVRRNSSTAAAASDEILAAHADQSLVVARILQTENVPQCAALTLTGSLTSSFKPGANLSAELATLSLLTLKAIKSGKGSSRYRNDPTDEQVQKYYDALVATGAEAYLIDAFYNDTMGSLSLRDQCAIGIAAYAAQANLPSSESAYWTSLDFAEVAKDATR